MLVFNESSFYSNLARLGRVSSPRRQLPRPRFATSLLGCLTLLSGLLFCVHSAHAQSGTGGQVEIDAQPAGYEWTFPTMGTRMSLTAYAADKQIAKEAFDAAEARVQEIASILSDYDPESETSLLTTAAHPNPTRVSDDLWKVLVASEQWYERTDGAFDSSLGTVTRIWRKYRRAKRIPSEEQILEALGSTGWKNVHLEEGSQSACLQKPGIKIDFGGIGKGFAVDEAFDVLQEFGLQSCLVNLSGNMRAGSPPPGRDAWRIEIAPVQRGEKPLRRIALQNSAIATSGDLWQFIEIDGVRRSHVLDPRTGYGVPGPTAATVIAKTAIDADALATAACILPSEQALKLCERWKAEALLAHLEDERRSVSGTGGFPPALP